MLKRILRPLIPVLAALPVAAFLLIAGQDQDEIALCAVLGLALSAALFALLLFALAV